MPKKRESVNQYQETRAREVSAETGCLREIAESADLCHHRSALEKLCTETLHMRDHAWSPIRTAPAV